jgi:hypothetical protein
MAAVTGHLERTKAQVKEDEGPDAPGTGETAGAFHGFGASESPPAMEQKHANLTRMVFGRRVIEDTLSQPGQKIELKEVGGKYHFYLDPPLRADVIPWSPAPAKPMKEEWDDPDLPVAGKYPRLSLWGLAGKMGCPTWDLPAGAGSVGGACPGAQSAQTVILKEDRLKALKDNKLRAEVPGTPGKKPGWGEIVPVRIEDTICGSCYAYVGQYSQPNVQAGEIIRLWWVKSVLDQGRGQEFEDVLVRSILTNSYPVTPYNFNGGPMKPIRIHSSGDFFSKEYLRAWVNVANKVFDIDPTIRFWAPTRMWVLPNWTRYFEEELDKLKGNNFMVRASAYHFNDPAPGKLHPKNAVGSCSIYAVDDARKKGKQDPRYDISCPIYDDKFAKGEKTCAAAPAPKGSGREGERGCRACWMLEDTRVNYQAHF